MIWLTWRQHRLEALACAGVLSICALLLITSGLHLHGVYDNGVAACQTTAASNPTCAGVLRQFELDFESAAGVVGWLNFAPALLGVFVGAPLLARELEHGTHRFVWCLGTTRGRWLAVKLASLTPAVLLFAAALTALFSWWLSPSPQSKGPFDAVHFDFQGLMPGAYTLFAFSLGAACGAVLGRTVVAMAATFGGFLLVRLPVEFWLRAHYMTPVTVTTRLAATASGRGLQLTTDAPTGAWVLNSDLVDGSGNPINLAGVCPPGSAGGITQCLSAHGVVSRLVYQPADRYWPFQLIEAGIFVVLALGLIGFAVWWVRRRTS